MDSSSYATVPISSTYATEAGGVPASLVELDSAIASLADALEELNHAGSTLVGRIEPVLRPPSPEVSAAMAGEIRSRAPVTCRIADEISSRTSSVFDATSTVRRIADNLRDARDRLEV